jgi:NADH-quinone oxidoreductase subunit L
MIHDQFFNFIQPQTFIKNTFWGKIKMTVYVLSIKEWNLDGFMYRFVWKPLKSVGNMLNFIGTKVLALVFIPVFLVGLYFIYHESAIPESIESSLAIFFASCSLILILRAFVERKNAILALVLVIVSQLFTSLAIGFNEQFDFNQIHLFLSGIFISGALAYACIWFLKSRNESISLNGFQGNSSIYPKLGFAFLVACLGLSGFPITPTFIGEDLILGHIHENQFVLLTLISLGLILDGLAIYRMYARLFLGPHLKVNHDLAYRSS